MQTSLFHTSLINESRIKRTVVHSPFFHLKKTAKHPDEPLTRDNKHFIQDMIKQSYGEGLQTYVRPDGQSNSPLRENLQPWKRGEWEEQGIKTRRIGLLGRKIGVYPMWLNNGKRVATTILQIEDNHVIKYIPPEDFSKTIVAEKRNIPRICFRDKVSCNFYINRSITIVLRIMNIIHTYLYLFPSELYCRQLTREI